ncbi:pre-rRNA-processing protein TSR1 homolog [Contarinia nasturtii]|uniref:pre-rRNA-processing protein TSR1 homolog n=1 Tax=Contarinia nasturtii TaxID=265458 RepID=UPI0012D4A81C|nr:pre-rRNA-processing protein TSR1 homolog [Contarinia nasturtii]
MGVDQQAHRAGALKQKNKVHKTGRHRSKGAIDNELKGKYSVLAITKKHKNAMTKEQRRHQAHQIRKNKRDEVMDKKRSLGGSSFAPFLIALIPLNEQIDPQSALSILKVCDPDAIVSTSPTGTTHITIPRFKQRFAFIIPPIGFGNELAALDCLKVCDTTVFLVSANVEEDEIYSKWGKRFINMAFAQGVPTPIISVMDMESIAPNRRGKTKIAIQKYIQKTFPMEKIISLDTNNDGFNLFRRIGGQKKKILQNKDNRSHLFAEQIEYVENTTDSKAGILKVTGHLRGISLDVNGLIHIPNLGDFQMLQIDLIADPFRHDKENIEETRVLLRATASKQISLQRENIPDEMDEEQTWPTEEEIAHAQAETKKMKLIKRIPKGMSDYQACWIPDIEEKDCIDESDDYSDDNSMEDDEDFMSCISDPDSSDEFEKNDQNADEECISIVQSEVRFNDDKYDMEIDLQEERETWEKLKDARSDKIWPDEIDTPLNIPARTRFQKYRGLESFRTSPWDIKENLPADYARIFQFVNFDRTKRRILKEYKDDVDGAEPGYYITIHVSNVPLGQWQKWKAIQDTKPILIIYGLLPHENQMCIMNTVLKRAPDSTIPIKSKERLIIQCGYRRFIVNPIFSQHTSNDRHKYERFFRPEETVVASFFAPIQFPPSPILCFKENPDTTLRLVANGILLSCNPDRVILKRVVLSGHPLKINRRTATIRYMFHNKEDIEYFKPLKLRTRCGRLGHIKESLGTHGHMKCVFDGQLKSFDTIFMYLYKRIFPKWTYEDCIVSVQDETNADIQNDTEMVE